MSNFLLSSLIDVNSYLSNNNNLLITSQYLLNTINSNIYELKYYINKYKNISINDLINFSSVIVVKINDISYSDLTSNNILLLTNNIKKYYSDILNIPLNNIIIDIISGSLIINITIVSSSETFNKHKNLINDNTFINNLLNIIDNNIKQFTNKLYTIEPVVIYSIYEVNINKLININFINNSNNNTFKILRDSSNVIFKLYKDIDYSKDFIVNNNLNNKFYFIPIEDNSYNTIDQCNNMIFFINNYNSNSNSNNEKITIEISNNIISDNSYILPYINNNNNNNINILNEANLIVNNKYNLLYLNGRYIN